MQKLLNQYGLLTSLLGILMIYLLFPNNNLSSDSYGYAVGIKNGQDLFSAHHLLYNGFYHFLSLPFRYFFPKIDVLHLCTLFNTFFAIAILFVFARILKLLQVKSDQINLWILFAGFSFGIWRFSLENESYIIAILYSLLSSYVLLKYCRENTKKYWIVCSGLFAALATLFHQIHMFWWLGLFFGIIFHFRSFKSAGLFVVPAFIIPIAYVLVLLQINPAPLSVQSFWEYLLHDYYKGNAGQIVPLKQILIFIAVATIRTFAQVYPYMLILLKQHWLFYIPIIVFLSWGLYFLFAIFKKNKIFFKNDRNNAVNWFLKIHLFILLLHVAFAFYSNGNAEFMIMAPVLLGIILAPRWTIYKPIFAGLVASIFIWNVVYAAFPMYYYTLINQSEKIEFLKQQSNLKYISFTNLMQNQNQYLGGDTRICFTDDQISPTILAQWVDSGYNVITDMPDDYKIVSRGSFYEKNLSDSVWKMYRLEPIHTTKSLYGDLHLYKVHSKAKQ